MQRKIPSIMVLIIIIALIAFFLIYLFYSKQSEYISNPVRPESFPKIIKVPKNAFDVEYRSHNVLGTFGVHFTVDDSYSSDKTRSFIQENLLTNGWKPLKYHLLNPHTSISRKHYEIDWPRPENNQKGWPPLEWQEDWLNNSKEYINIYFKYISKEQEKNKFNMLYISISFYNKGNLQIQSFIDNYKQLHPEEFQEDVNNPQMENR